MKKRSPLDTLGGLAMVGQLGITLIVPILLFTFLGVWLSERFSLGVWVIILGVFIGLLTAFCSFIQFARGVIARTRKRDVPPLADPDDRQEDNHLEN
jgi:hypothetical protein